MSRHIERGGRHRAAPYPEYNSTESIFREEAVAHAQLSTMLDSLATALAAIADARGTLQALYAGPTASPDVESFLAAEAEDQDIVAHLAYSARSLRATHAIVQAHRDTFATFDIDVFIAEQG